VALPGLSESGETDNLYLTKEQRELKEIKKQL